MRALPIAPAIFEGFPQVKTSFIVVEKNNLPKRFVMLEQVHGEKIVEITEYQPFLKSVDGAYTRKPNIYIAIRSADCLPVLFYNKETGIVGGMHAGWRGTAKGIIKKTVNGNPADFYFYLGPAAQSCCYDKDFVKENLAQLEEMKVPVDQIENSGICTIHNLEYPSHRREREKRKETILNIIGLENLPLQAFSLFSPHPSGGGDEEGVEKKNAKKIS